MVAFYYEQGIQFDLATYEQRTYLFEYQEAVLSDDPLRIRITIPLAGDELHVTFDDQMDVLDVTP